MFAGDFNVADPRLAATRRRGEGIDHVLVRGAPPGAVDVWRVGRRTVERRRALRPRAGRVRGGGRVMTFAEARALFPVLERIAYLNPGRSGRSPSRWPRRSRPGLQRDLAEGRSGVAEYFEETLALRDELRIAFAGLVGVRAGAGGAHELDDRWLRDRAPRPRPRPRGRDRDDHRRALRPARPAGRLAGAGRRGTRRTPSGSSPRSRRARG